jgi:hypothetical protein
MTVVCPNYSCFFHSRADLLIRADAGDAMPSDELLEMLSPEAREALMAHKKAAEESAGKLFAPADRAAELISPSARAARRTSGRILA